MASAGMAVLVASASMALGQIGSGGELPGQKKEVARLEPPTMQPPREDQSLSVQPMLAAILIGGAAIGVNFIPSKRGHQD